MTTSFRILHLSDLHFGQDADRLASPVEERGIRSLRAGLASRFSGNWIHPATHSTAGSRALARFVLEEIIERKRPDLIFVSGDLATTGSVADLKSASSFLGPHSGGRWVNSDDSARLVSNGVPISALPGNHDRYRPYLLPGGTNFEAMFAGMWKSCTQSGRVAVSAVLQRNDERVALVSADFTFRNRQESSGGLAYIGQGRVHSDVLDELVDKTKSFTSEGIAVVWAVHYPPSCPDIKNDLMLLGSKDLVLAAKREGIRLLFAGHTHAQLLYRLNDLTVCCAGSAMQRDAEERWGFSHCEVSIHNGKVSGGRVAPYSYRRYGTNDFVRDGVHKF